MKYTIIDTDKKAQFIAQQYDTQAEAQKRLDGLGAKVANLRNRAGEKYGVVVVGVDDDGEFHDLTKAAATKPAPDAKK